MIRCHNIQWLKFQMFGVASWTVAVDTPQFHMSSSIWKRECIDSYQSTVTMHTLSDVVIRSVLFLAGETFILSIAVQYLKSKVLLKEFRNAI